MSSESPNPVSPDTDDAGEAVLTTFHDGVGRLTLNNPRRKNAITLEMAAAIEEFCDRVTADGNIGAVVVDAAGSYFCSGADTRILAGASADPAAPESVAQLSAVYRAFVRVGSLPVPTVGVVVGGAVGAGLNLALAVDLLVTTPDAVLDSGFLARGIHPGGGHLTLLNRAVGRADTIALAACGQSLSGAQAVERGLAYAAAPVPDIPAIVADLTGPAARDPELTRRVMASVRLELGPPAVTWDSAIEIERGVQMWSMARKGQNWSSRGPGRS
ncbi:MULTISPECIES: enoyl-CoA hydratase/isomerase family protein [unclassified Gordonia (in: high G+C Gram-positive bacteria)]|uniref:enoyl-CoA hydratase-related protein n=1 Tax=unclassified Gordonia (in: high G+C Gram-positive bacteria) TaxID=2657482 RepID=UPI000990B0F4|nr:MULTISPECIES: enoyl-CoA hydratase/isomerase family protein [unclassified Gordonia (in: high G+C Gram-positive bacteria)]MCX2756487.1 enoyl-CoA hydratase-related protein [Gordonia sp. 4N]